MQPRFCSRKQSGAGAELCVREGLRSRGRAGAMEWAWRAGVKDTQAVAVSKGGRGCRDRAMGVLCLSQGTRGAQDLLSTSGLLWLYLLRKQKVIFSFFIPPVAL